MKEPSSAASSTILASERCCTRLIAIRAMVKQLTDAQARLRDEVRTTSSQSYESRTESSMVVRVSRMLGRPNGLMSIRLEKLQAPTALANYTSKAQYGSCSGVSRSLLSALKDWGGLSRDWTASGCIPIPLPDSLEGLIILPVHVEHAIYQYRCYC